MGPSARRWAPRVPRPFLPPCAAAPRCRKRMATIWAHVASPHPHCHTEHGMDLWPRGMAFAVPGIPNRAGQSAGHGPAGRLRASDACARSSEVPQPFEADG
eukprot:7008140-Prymnesium_polylepis.1